MVSTITFNGTPTVLEVIGILGVFLAVFVTGFVIGVAEGS